MPSKKEFDPKRAISPTTALKELGPHKKNKSVDHPESSFFSPIGKKLESPSRSVRFEDAMSFWQNQEASPESQLTKRSQDKFLLLQDTYIADADGLSDELMSSLKNLAKCSVLYLPRTKPREMSSARTDVSSPKSVHYKVKTAFPSSACFGHLPVILPEGMPEIVESIDASKELYTLVVEGKPEFVTFERQTLRYIRDKILSKQYQVIKMEPSIAGSTPYMLIQDRSVPPGIYRIDLTDFKKPTGLRPTVRQASKLFDMDKIKEADDLEKIENLIAFGPLTKQDSEARDLNALYNSEEYRNFFNSDTYLDNLDNTVKLLRSDREGNANQNAHIICDSQGRPIKGDVDLQHSVLPDYLPIYALHYIRVVNKTNIDSEYAALLLKFNDLIQDLKASSHANAYLIDVVKKAVDRMRKITDSESKLVLIADIGTINVFNAAMLIGLNTDILHGSDSGSPILPENITVTEIPNPVDKNAKSFFLTHSELEYLELLHSNEQLTENKIMEFNPCWFVPCKGALHEWRKDLALPTEAGGFTSITIDADGNKHECKNLTNEDQSIKLWLLLFEKQLLQYKLRNPDRFNSYVRVIESNFDRMLNNSIYETPDKLKLHFDTMQAGIARAEKIIAEVRSHKYAQADQINSRIDSIRNASQQLEQTHKNSNNYKNS